MSILPLTVTTRIITFLVGDSYQGLFDLPLLLGGSHTQITYMLITLPHLMFYVDMRSLIFLKSRYHFYNGVMSIIMAYQPNPPAYPPKSKGLIRPYSGKPMVSKPLIRPCFWVGWPDIMSPMKPSAIYWGFRRRLTRSPSTCCFGERPLRGRNPANAARRGAWSAG